MDIRILELMEGAGQAKGLAVIIDVFRAFSVACYAYDAGANGIISTADVDSAFSLKELYSDSVLVGERNEKKVEGFDLGNSPTEILKTDLKGKTVIHTTTAGTNGLVIASGADMVITGSLVNSAAIIRFIRKMNPAVVSLVAMGYRGTESTEEDILCAKIIENGLNNGNYDFSAEIDDLRFSSGQRFFRPENLRFSPASDFFLCTMMDRFNFVLEGKKRKDGNIDLIKYDI